MKRSRTCAHSDGAVAVAMLSHGIGLASEIAAIIISSLGIAVAGGGVVMLALGLLFGRDRGVGDILAPIAIACGIVFACVRIARLAGAFG
jgi:hypothetical protein